MAGTQAWQGFIYLATVIDCYSKKVVGWSIADHMRTELVEDALRNAASTTTIEPDAIWHSDRGSVYTSADYPGIGEAPGYQFLDRVHRRVLDKAIFRPSRSLSALKNERVYRTVYATKEPPDATSSPISRGSTTAVADTPPSAIGGRD